jgi:hypothetical protein
MSKQIEKAYIKSAIPNNEVSEKILDMIEAFDEGGGGGPLTTDIVSEGIVNKYYTEARVNANIDNKLATKSGKVLPVASQYVYVNYISGNDSTGDGASDTPFKTINVAMTAIVDASQNKPYVIGLLGARQIETGDILVKPYVSIVGMGQRASYIRATGFNIKPDPLHSTGTSWVLLKNFYLGGGTGINWDLQALGGSNSAVVIENLTIGGNLVFKGRNAGGGDYLEMYTGVQFGTVTLDSTYSQVQTFEFVAAVNITNTQSITGASATINNSNFNNSLYVTSSEISLNNCAFPGTAGLTTTGNVVINSYRGVPPLARRTLSVGTTINESAETTSSSEKYTKTITLGDWSGPSAGEYTLTVAYSFHGITNPKAVCYETNGANFDQVLVPTTVNASNDIIITVNETIDARFLGKIVID